MSDKTFHVSVVTPERAVTEGEAVFVALPAHDGEIGVLRGRAPLVCKLDVGQLRIKTPGGETERWFIDGGFAEVSAGRLTVLTEAAQRPEELDRAAAKQALEAARALPAVGDDEYARRQHDLKAAREQLRLVD
ncbi:MAG: ATP synthase F1 subunit epsilon [Thermoanaerobaculia bacterium]|nr:ATP synthase F1 subunit epsilon [Thermoanaerobaculia bacterium]